MGFSSYKCKSCGITVLTSYSDNYLRMSNVVAIMQDGTVHRGTYDGYGRVDGIEIREVYEIRPQVYHACCYNESELYTGGSEDCEHQGFFIDEETVNELVRGSEQFREAWKAYYNTHFPYFIEA